MTKTISIVGSLNVDLIFKLPRMPHPGETLPGAEFSIGAGGKGLNQAIACKKFGQERVNTVMLGALGGDAHAAMLKQTLKAAGVSCDTLHTTSANSGTALIQVIKDTGENRIAIAAGANGEVTPDLVNRSCGNWIRTSSALLMQLEIPMESVVAAAAIATEKGVPVCLNAAPALPLPDVLWGKITHFIVNESEAKTLSGIDVVDDSSAEAACEIFESYGVQHSVIITRGHDGCTVMECLSGKIHHIEAEKVDVIDTTGAGDAFVGAYTSAIVLGHSIRSAAECATVAGSLTVEGDGAAASMPHHETVKHFMRRRQRRCRS